jgi:hypothetical protein
MEQVSRRIISGDEKPEAGAVEDGGISDRRENSMCTQNTETQHLEQVPHVSGADDRHFIES